MKIIVDMMGGDNAPLAVLDKSLLGRFWRWHINFCPGWKAYFLSLSEEERHVLRKQYAFHKPQIRN